MTDVHGDHDHQHASGCGHTAVIHGDHTDYLHDGHLHQPSGGMHHEHTLEVSDSNPDDCTPSHAGCHDGSHHHQEGCGHEPVPHGNHQDFLCDGHLHHPHDNHCDNHGGVKTL